MDAPEVKTKKLPDSWPSSWNCGSCNSLILLSSKSHCRACGNCICASCAKTRTLPDYGLGSARHVVCSRCLAPDFSGLWQKMAFESETLRSISSGVIGIHFLYPSSKRPFADFSQFRYALDYVRCAFLCSDVPPIDAPGEPFLYRQREAWLRFATASLAAAVKLYNLNRSLHTAEATAFRTRVRVALTITRLLAASPDDSKPERCWDAARESLIDSADDGAYLLCLLVDTKGDWKAVGDLFLGRKWLVPALFAFQVNDDAFDEAAFLLELASRQPVQEDIIFFTAAAALVNEAAVNVIQLASVVKKAGYLKWAVEILCAMWEKWKDSSQSKKGHVLLMDCLETVTPKESPDVLMAGYTLLCTIMDGHKLIEYRNKLHALQNENINITNREAASQNFLRNLRYQVSLNSADLFAALLIKCFKELDVQELQHIIAYQTRIYAASDRTRLPAAVRANLLLPEAVLDILQGRCMEGLRKLLDALVMAVGAGTNEYLKLASEVLVDPATRATFLKLWRDGLGSTSTVSGLLSSAWLADVGASLDSSSSAEFQFARSLRNSPELRAFRMVERAVDGVSSRDGPFEAAMSCVDASVVCVGQAARLKMLLKASRYLFHAASNIRCSPAVPDSYACIYVGSSLLNAAVFSAGKLSPVLRACFVRQILFQQLAFLQKSFSFSTNRIPAATEELLSLTENSFNQLLALQSGFPIICAVQPRAFDDLICEMVFDKLSDATVTKLELKLAGLVTYEQWTYWRFEGAWQNWLHNPLNDEVDARDEQRRGEKARLAFERRLREEELSSEQVAQERREEAEYARRSAVERSKNAWQFLEDERGDAIVRYLYEKRWQWENVSKLMNCMCVPRTIDGFIDPKRGLAPRSDHLFSSFDGFEVDRASGTVKFLLTESRRSGKPALFGWREVREIFNTGAPAMVFSLDSIDSQRQHHPLQLLHFKPDRARGTTVLSCMFHTDYILKFLTCGLEISCAAPFKQRDIREGFFNRLPSRVQEDLSVIWSSGGSAGVGDQAHRFWIDAGNLPYSETRTDDNFRILYGKQAMRVKKHKLKVNAEGELVDDDGDAENPEDREAQFAANFTRHYDTVATVFPEFAMLAEFTKMIAATFSLLNEAENCKGNIKHLSTQLNTLANDMESSLKRDLGSIEFPVANSRKVDDLIEEHVRETDRINGYRLTFSQKREVREKCSLEYQRQAREADNKQVESLAKHLQVSSSTVRDMLISKNFRSVALGKARTLISSATAKFENALSALRKEGLPVDGDISELIKRTMEGGWSTAPASDFSCEWVPAVFRAGVRGDGEGEGEGGTYRVYGGVSLQAQLNKQVVNPPPNSQFFTSTATLSAQRAIGAPFSTAARIDNQNRANQDFFNRMNATLGRAAERQAHIMTTFANREASMQRSAQSSGQVYRYASNVAGVNGSYWSPDAHRSTDQARQNLAVTQSMNTMKFLAVSSIPPNASYYSGRVGPQTGSDGTYYAGGGTQYVMRERSAQAQMAQTARVYVHEWTPRFFDPQSWKQIK
jgi:hypothetical protein